MSANGPTYFLAVRGKDGTPNVQTPVCKIDLGCWMQYGWRSSGIVFRVVGSPRGCMGESLGVCKACSVEATGFRAQGIVFPEQVTVLWSP